MLLWIASGGAAPPAKFAEMRGGPPEGSFSGHSDGEGTQEKKQEKKRQEKKQETGIGEKGTEDSVTPTRGEEMVKEKKKEKTTEHAEHAEDAEDAFDWVQLGSDPPMAIRRDEKGYWDEMRRRFPSKEDQADLRRYRHVTNGVVASFPLWVISKCFREGGVVQRWALAPLLRHWHRWSGVDGKAGLEVRAEEGEV